MNKAELKDLVIELFIENGKLKKELGIKEMLLNDLRENLSAVGSERNLYLAELLGYKNRLANTGIE